MLSKKLITLLTAAALTSSAPAFAQSSSAEALRVSPALSEDASAVRGADGIGWVMGGLVFASVVIVLLLILSSDNKAKSA